MPGQGRQGPDSFQRLARREGYRARSSYKLLDIDKRSKLFKKGFTVLDLGAAPGGWTQVALEKIGESGKVFAVDILSMAPIEGATMLQGDILNSDFRKTILETTGPVDVVISDISPNLSGNYSVDQARSVELSQMALHLSVEMKAKSFVTKVFQGEDFSDFKKEVNIYFKSVRVLSPLASRKTSSEVYVIAKNRKS